MKKAIQALPALSLLAYLVAVVMCIVNTVRGAPANLTSIIIFSIYVVGVIVMMSFSTNFLIKKKREANKKDEDDRAFEDLAAVAAEAEAEAESKDEAPSEEAEESDENEIPEETEEASEDETAEVDVVSTEGADEDESDDGDSDEDDSPAVIPVIIPVDTDEDEDEEDEEADDEADDDDDDDDDDDGVNVAIGGVDIDNDGTADFRKSRYTRTYAAKLIQADDELKSYYSIVKNAFLSYKKVTCSVSREHERVRRGRTTMGIIKVRGKSLLVYLALDPAQFENTMYVGEDVSSVSKYAATPFLYRVKGPRKANRAAKLIAMLAEKMELAPTAVPANEDYVARFPYEDTDALLEKGLIIDNIAEAERKAEEARIAAEEAEAAANKAIEEAIKAKEHAAKVSERSERTLDEIGVTEETKATKQ